MEFVKYLSEHLLMTVIVTVIVVGFIAWLVYNSLKMPSLKKKDNPVPEGDVAVEGPYRPGTDVSWLAEHTNEGISKLKATFKTVGSKPLAYEKDLEMTMEEWVAVKEQLLKWDSHIHRMLKAWDVKMRDLEELKDKIQRVNRNIHWQDPSFKRNI